MALKFASPFAQLARKSASIKAVEDDEDEDPQGKKGKKAEEDEDGPSDDDGSDQDASQAAEDDPEDKTDDEGDEDKAKKSKKAKSKKAEDDEDDDPADDGSDMSDKEDEKDARVRGARARERGRIRAIMTSGAGLANPTAAAYLAVETSMSRDTAIGTLNAMAASAHQNAAPRDTLRDRMSSTPAPNVGADASGGKPSVAAAIIAAGKKRRGEV